jgi:DNA-binding MarR family transcriptional regulator
MMPEVDLPRKESMAVMNPQQQPVSPPTPPIALSGDPRPFGSELPADDQSMLETLVDLSLRLRLRGLDLESTTGLAGRELDLVALLTSSGPTSVKSLVADLGLPRSTMTAIVDRLQERGLVIRHPNPEDRRSVVLEATPAAHEALRRYHEGMMGLVEHIKKALTESEVAELDRLIQKFADGF